MPLDNSATADSEYYEERIITNDWARDAMYAIFLTMTEGNQDIWRLVNDTADNASTRNNQVYFDATGNNTDWDSTPANHAFWNGSDAVTPDHFGDKSFIAIETTDEYPGTGRMQIIIQRNGTIIDWKATSDSSLDPYDPLNVGVHPGTRPGGWTHASATLAEDTYVPGYTFAPAFGDTVHVGVNNRATYNDGTTDHAIPVFTLSSNGEIIAYYFGGYRPAKPTANTKPHMFLSGSTRLTNASQQWGYRSSTTNQRCRMDPGYPPYTTQLSPSTSANVLHFDHGSIPQTGQEVNGAYLCPSLLVVAGNNRDVMGGTDANFGPSAGSIYMEPGRRNTPTNTYVTVEGVWLRKVGGPSNAF